MIRIIMILLTTPLSLTAEQAVDMAMQENLSLKNSTITMSQTEREYKNSWNVFLPSLSASGSLGYSDRLFSEASVSPVRAADPWSLSFGLSASLPLNVSAAPGLEAARLEYEAGVITWEQARAETRRSVLKNYYSLLTQQANLRLLEENTLLAESTLETVQTKFDRGLLPETDLLEARVNAGRIRNNWLNARAAYENGLMAFCVLLGLPPDTPLELSGTLEAPRSAIDENKALEAVAGSPVIRQLMLNIRILEKNNAALITGSLTPTLSLGLAWRESVSAPFEGESWSAGSWQDALSLTLSLTVPLDGFIPGSQTDIKIAAGRDAIEMARNNQAAVLARTQTEVRGLLNSLENAERASLLNLENYRLAQRNLDLTREAWRAGTRSLLEVGTRQADLLSAGQDYLLSLYSWIGYLLDLEYTLGITEGGIQ
jgi:outer membrane protein TolC